MNEIDALKKGPKFWNIWLSENKRNLNLDFSNTDLEGLNLYSSDLPLNLQGANFSNCNLSRASFALVNLENAVFTNSNLKNVSFRKSNCRNAIFKGANLVNSNFHRANIQGADFTDAILSNSEFDVKNGEDIILTNASIYNLKLADFFPWTNSFLGTDPFQLITVDGLENVNQNSQKFVLDYIKTVFQALSPGGSFHYLKEEQPTFYNKIIKKSYSLHDIFTEKDIRPEIITISQNVNKELIKYLQKNPKELYRIHWRTFEELIAEILKSFGWEINITKMTKDGGYDLFGIYKDESGIRHNWLIECKKWDKNRLVGIDVVRSLYGTKTDLKVGNALLATTSFFTKGVYDFKSSHYDFETKDFFGIIEWLNAYKVKNEHKMIIENDRLIKK